ncbi:uncharacterized protein LOC129769885 [Toxorhynchites rutilus septentrionalis]|uniref:uncharacterized protein LOC129769885 n=1 Tax=Toxorhynchites rutilus septentrionalis TaxID=329112 RepID=UPI0024795AAF|nr:uncharacterized protein LOC129769885 [Toxorhynchites rutilus septentrionalis]
MGQLQEIYREHFGQQRLLKIRYTQNLLEDIEEEDQQWNVVRNEHHRAHRLTFCLLLYNCTIDANEKQISIRSLNQQPLFVYDQGIGRIRYDFHYYIHHFNITSLRVNIDILQSQYNKVKTNQFSHLIQDKFHKINDGLKKLSLTRRHKRWDTLGSIWKFIAGSPDANDLRMINSTINNIIDENNKQVKINRKITTQMKEYICKTSEAISLFNSKALEIHSINIYLNLKYLSEKLENILDSMTLAKLGLISEKILSTDELDVIIQDLRSQNLTIHTNLEALNYIETSVATNDKEMVLLIKTPVLDNRIFRKIHVYPTIQDNKQIYLTNRLFLVHSSGNYITKNLNQTIFDRNEIKRDVSECVPKLTNIPKQEVLHLDNQHILMNSIDNIHVETTCGITNKTLNGSFLITFHNCTAILNNLTYNVNRVNLGGNPTYLPLDSIVVEQQHDSQHQFGTFT